MIPTSRAILVVLISFQVTRALAWVNGVAPSASSFPLVGRDVDVGYTGDFNWSENIMTVPGRAGLDVAESLTVGG